MYEAQDNYCTIEKKGKAEKLTKFKIRETTLFVSVLCTQAGKEYNHLALMYKHKAEEDRTAYLIPTKVEKRGKGMLLSAEVDLKRIPFRMSNWQILATYEDGESIFGAPVKAPNKKKDILDRFENDFCCELGDYIVFPYYSTSGIINLRYRQKNEYDTKEIHERERIAYKNSKSIFKKKLYRQDIALIYEKRCAAAQDNGYYLFKYCMDKGVNEKGNIKVFYVVDKRTPAYEKIKQYDKYVLDFMSVEHMEHLLAAKTLISSESRAHAYAWHSKNSIVATCIQEKKHVFLGHGILALKRLNSSFTAKNMNSNLVTVSSEREGKIFKNDLGYKEKNIEITGYARFDALEDMSENYNEILIMPTHRERLFGVEKEVFVKSEYYKRYMELLNSDRFASILERKNLNAKFYLHPSIKEHTDLFTSNSNRIEIVKYGEIALDELMMRCKLLISDYSSILWDVLYMKKPALFYQFDREEYMKSWGSYIDIESELPGENAISLDSLLDNLEYVTETKYMIQEKHIEKMAGFYKYTDQKNCERIWEEISKL